MRVHFKPSITFFLCLISFLAFLAFTPFSLSFASDEPFTYPSNWGGTGLMETPTARVMKKHSFRIGAGQVKPYRYYYGAISPLKGLEIDGRITELLDISSGLVDQNNYKDKAIDLKYQFLQEGKYMPAFALGIMDPHGSRIFPSQYIAASKQIYPFDFSLGFGNGRFGKKPLTTKTENFRLEMFSNTRTWLEDSQFFGGIQFAPSEQFALMLEYSPVLYHKQTPDPARAKYFLDPVSSKFNFGLRYKPTSWSELDVSYQRGEEFGVSLSLLFDIGQPLIPIYNPPYREKSGISIRPYDKRIMTALSHLGFSDIYVHEAGGELWIEAQNGKYFYDMEAVGIIVKVLSEITPDTTGRIHILLKKNEIPMMEFITTKEDIIDLYAGNITFDEFLYLARLTTEPSRTEGGREEYKSPFTYGLKPSIETFLNDPSGFFKYRLGLSGWAGYRPWKGGSLITGLDAYPLNNISTSNEPLSIPVRSDIVFYKQDNVNLSMLMYDQVERIGPRLFGRVSAGILEIEYSGVDGEIAMPLFAGRILVGAGGSAVKKRDPDSPFRVLDSNDDEKNKDLYTTAFFNTRLNIPELEMSVDVKAGRFLAGDKGARFTITKTINGVKLWAWYSITDTSIFTDQFNRDYHDKGIGISIPLRLFKGTDSKTAYNYVLSPWTRDTGQDIYHFNSLFNFIGRNLKIYLDKDKKIMYK